MRVQFGGGWIAQSDDVVILHEPGRYPVAYFPRADLAGDVLRDTERTTDHPELGRTAWFAVRNGDHVAADFFSKDAADNPMSAVMGSTGPSWEFKKGKPAVVAAKAKFQAVLNKKGTVVRVSQADVQARAAADSGDPGDAQPAGTNGKH